MLAAFARHPDRLASLLEEKDDAEAAYAFFDAAAQLAVSASERADRLGLTRERRAELADVLRALVAPSGCAPDWVERVEEATRAAPAPAPPEISDSEISVPREAFEGDGTTEPPDLVAHAASGAEVTSRPTPARSELSVYVQLTRASAARAAARAEPPADIRESRRDDDDDDDAARLAFLLGFDDVLRSGGVTHTTPTASPCGPSASCV